MRLRRPADGWKQSGDIDPQVALARGRRVVVTEFDVEFVSYQFQACKQHQLILVPKVHPLELIGIGRRYTELAAEQQRALAADLYNAFLQDLHSRGLELVPRDVLQASPAYVASCGEPVVGSSLLMMFNPLGSDTGTVMHTQTVAAPGLCVPKGSPHARAAAEARIVQETRGRGACRVTPGRHLPEAPGPGAP